MKSSNPRTTTGTASGEIYAHTQMGWPILITVEIAALVCLYFALTQHLVVAGITFVLLSFAGSLFFSLTVVATRETLMVRFGPGLVRKSFKIKDVSSIRPITTSVWNGWGIRFMGDGTVLFNVSGFKAVKLTTTNGKSFAIGTDEPDKLVAFVENARRSWA